MKQLIFGLAVGIIITASSTSLFGQAVSEEAKRHFNRGVAAVEMAKSAADYEAAIKEFKQAIDLAPDWADAYYNLGKVQEQAEKFADAVASFRQYLRLSPKASDTDTVKSLIDKLEFKAEKTSASRPKSFKNQQGIEMVWIPPGSFDMGSNNGWADEKPVHRVTISQGFFMGKYEVTQAQWLAVMGANPSLFKGDFNLPVENVSWNDAREFVNKLNEMNDGYKYRMPTEAEWEYACRAGTTGDYYASDPDDIAWYSDNSGSKTHKVGTKQANAFGLYDMSGNVWEWCRDWFHPDYTGAPTDGSAWLSGGEMKSRVLRGGSWHDGASYLRSASRNFGRTPDLSPYNGGFRLVAVVRTQ